jgi:hypothetical protein
MSVEEKIKQLSTEEMSKFLFDFFIGFHNESINGLCNIECGNSKESCFGCIQNWLRSDISTCNILS